MSALVPPAAEAPHCPLLETDRLCTLLKAAVNRTESELRAALLPAGVSFAHWRVMKCLLARGTLRVSEVAEAVGYETAFLTRLASALENRGLLARYRPDKGDRRRVDLSLTAAGRERAEQAAALMEQAAARIMARLRGPEHAQLGVLLERMADATLKNSFA